RRRHTRFSRDWSSDVCSSDLADADHRPDGGPLRRAAARVVILTAPLPPAPLRCAGGTFPRPPAGGLILAAPLPPASGRETHPVQLSSETTLSTSDSVIRSTPSERACWRHRWVTRSTSRRVRPDS